MAVGRREEIDAARHVWARQERSLFAPRRLADLVGLEILFGVVLDRLAGLGIDAVGPVDLLSVLRRREELPVVAIQGVEKTVAAEMRNDIAIFAVDLGVDQLI